MPVFQNKKCFHPLTFSFPVFWPKWFLCDSICNLLWLPCCARLKDAQIADIIHKKQGLDNPCLFILPNSIKFKYLSDRRFQSIIRLNFTIPESIYNRINSLTGLAHRTILLVKGRISGHPR